MNERINENELVLPVLYVISKKQTKNETGMVSTKEVIKEVSRIVNPDGEDLEPSPTRSGETKFEQKVRNLISHKKITKYIQKGNRRGQYKLSENGETYVEIYKEVMKDLDKAKNLYITA